MLTSSWWTDEIGDAMEEIDHTQCRGQVLASHQVGCHHGDQGHIGTVKVTVQNSEGHKERESLQQCHKEAAEAFHHHREDVTSQTVGLQTPAKAQRKCYQRRIWLHCYILIIRFVFKSRFGSWCQWSKEKSRDSYFMSVSQPKVMFPTMSMTPRIDIRKAALCWLRPFPRAYGTR